MAIDQGDRLMVKACFELAWNAWRQGDNDVQNALGVSYIEHLDFDDGKVPRRWACRLLARPLREAAVELGTAPGTDRR